ncbi:hypothetical protein GCM10027343_01380 [Noviherbaspirillum agri]
MQLSATQIQQIGNLLPRQAGDEVLRQLGSILTNSVRASDVACRFGGEEFLVLLPATGRPGQLS